MSDMHVKGTHLLNVFRFVRWKRGVLGVNALLDELRAASGMANFSEDSYLEKEWYDYEEYLELLRAADAVLGNGDLARIYDMGEWTVQNLGHLSYLTRAPDIREFIRSGMENWHMVYDFGDLELVKDLDREMVVRYSGFPPAPEKCQYFRGSLMGMMKLCGLSGGRVEEVACNTKGSDFCEFRLTWD